MKINKTLNELFNFPGFRAASKLKGRFGDSPARIVALARRQKKRYAVHAARSLAVSMTASRIMFATWTPAARASIWNSNIAEWSAGVAAV